MIVSIRARPPENMYGRQVNMVNKRDLQGYRIKPSAYIIAVELGMNKDNPMPALVWLEKNKPEVFRAIQDSNPRVVKVGE